MEDIDKIVLLHKYGSSCSTAENQDIPVNRSREIDEMKQRLEDEQRANQDLRNKIDSLESLLQKQTTALNNKSDELSSLHARWAHQKEELQRVTTDRNHLRSKLEADKKSTGQALELSKQLESERKVSRCLEGELSTLQASLDNERKLRGAIESNLMGAADKAKQLQKELDFVVEHNKREKDRAFDEFTQFRGDAETFLASCQKYHEDVVNNAGVSRET